MLTCGQITDGVAGPGFATLVEDEEAITGGMCRVIFKPSNVLELGAGGPVIKDEDVFPVGAGWAAVFGAADDRKGGLAMVVGKEEVTGRGGAVPGATDRTTAEDVFGRQAHQDLPYHDLIRETTGTEERRRYSCACGIHHNRRLGSRFRPRKRSQIDGAVTASAR
jgi:hypothetical protein